jgi:hypothetical protein
MLRYPKPLGLDPNLSSSSIGLKNERGKPIIIMLQDEKCNSEKFCALQQRWFINYFNGFVNLTWFFAQNVYIPHPLMLVRSIKNIYNCTNISRKPSQYNYCLGDNYPKKINPCGLISPLFCIMDFRNRKLQSINLKQSASKWNCKEARIEPDFMKRW